MEERCSPNKDVRPISVKCEDEQNQTHSAAAFIDVAHSGATRPASVTSGLERALRPGDQVAKHALEGGQRSPGTRSSQRRADHEIVVSASKVLQNTARGGALTPTPRGPVPPAGAQRPMSSRKPIIPKSSEDWDPWKPILQDLYMRQNRILRDIIIIMDTVYKFKATQKMYKRQFGRWKFYKYAVKTRPKDVELRGVGKPASRGSGMDNHDTIDSLVYPLIYESDQSRVMFAGLTAVRHFLHGFVDLDPANSSAEVVFEFDDPCYRYFKTATDLFDSGENANGGRVLRLAFLQVERKVSTMGMKSFSDLCFLVPHLLLESNRVDILGAYLRYLGLLAKLKLGEDHPFAKMVAAFAELIHQPNDIMRYIMALAQINADTVGGLKGVVDRTRMWAQYQSEACQRTRGAARPGRTEDQHEHRAIELEAQSVFWAQNLLMRSAECDELARQWLRREFDEDFGVRCEAALAGLRAAVTSGQFPAPYARMMECLFVGWLADWFETKEDWPKMFEWSRKGLELSTNEQTVMWSIHIENVMREHGAADEADELRKRRENDKWLDGVRLQVDKLSVS